MREVFRPRESIEIFRIALNYSEYTYYTFSFMYLCSASVLLQGSLARAATASGLTWELVARATQFLLCLYCAYGLIKDLWT